MCPTVAIVVRIWSRYHSQPSQRLMCSSNSVACSAGSSPSRNSVASSTISWQVRCRSSATEMTLQGGPNARSGAVQEHSLVGGRDVECRAYLLGAVALEIAHADHRLLCRREVGDRAHRDAQRLAVLHDGVRRGSPVG